MENRDNFYIRRVQNVGTENKCPACGDSFTTNYLAVHDSGGLPICELCAWEKDAALAALLFLSDTACAYHMAEPPPHIVDGLEQRQGDPERLKRKLQEAHARLGGWDHNSLGEVLKGQIKAALDSGKVETMRKAQQLVLETERTHPHFYDEYDEIPF